jgi:hypothetical protein
MARLNDPHMYAKESSVVPPATGQNASPYGTYRRGGPILMPTPSAILPLSLKPPPLAFGDVNVEEDVAVSGVAIVGEDEE